MMSVSRVSFYFFNFVYPTVTAEVSSLTRLTNDASRHQFLAQMPKAKVSWLLCIGRLVSKTDNVMHFARLVKQAGVDLVSRPICLYGAYMVHRYKARHTHKCLYTVLPKYSKIQVLPGITSCRLVKDNKQAIELNSLLLNNMPKDGYGWN